MIAGQVVGLVESTRLKMPRLGTRKLYHILKESLKELSVGRDKLFNILKANQLTIRPKRNYSATTNTYHRFYKHTDMVSSLQINRPEQVWVADITYVGSRAAGRYLALITDAYSKKVVGYDLSESLSADGSLRALKMALKGRAYPGRELIHHSDKGIQYCCDQYQQQLTKGKLKCSMTQGHDSYSNAVAERVNGIIKNEFGLKDNTNLEIMQAIVAEIYNEQRPHLSCSLLTPSEMHKQNQTPMKTYKAKWEGGLTLLPINYLFLLNNLYHFFRTTQ